MNQRKRAVWGFILCSLLCCGAGVSAKEAAAGEKAAMPLWTRAAVQYENPYFTGNPDAFLSAGTLSSWWTVFHDDTLNELIEKALDGSRDMEEARSRLLQAREQVGITKAEKLPWVNAAGGWVRGEMPDDITRGILPAQLQNMPFGIEGSNSATYAGLDASWELDLFGKKSAKVREARGALEAQRGMLYSTWVSLSAEVAMNYITLRTLQAELDVTEKSIANMKENLSLMQVNQESGLVSSVPVDQLTYTLKETEAQISELKSSIAGTMSKIAILTGTTPGALDAMLMTPKPRPDIDPTLYNAIPADVLRQRPDVYAAESAWAAQIAKTDEAKAVMKPKISILGVLGLATLGTGGLFSAGSRAFGIMPQVTFPLFNGGALRRNVNVQSDKEKEAKAKYENTVLKAAGEVRTAMTAVSQDKVRQDSLETGRDKAKEALDLAENQYQHGLSDYMGVLDAERHYLSLNQSCAVAKGKQMTDLVSLFKALGGGWKPLDEETIKGAKNDQNEENAGGEGK